VLILSNLVSSQHAERAWVSTLKQSLEVKVRMRSAMKGEVESLDHAPIARRVFDGDA
jgi:hypothetical protein